MTIIQDSHCHPLRTLKSSAKFEEEWLTAQIQQIVFCTTHSDEWRRAIEFGESFDQINPHLLLGIHPWWAERYHDKKQLKNTITELESLVIQNPKIGIGECGLDAHIKKKVPLELQEQILIPQLQIAHQYKRKVNLHCVKATGRLQSIISQFPGLEFTLHSYKGSRESTEIWIKLGAKFSLGKRSFDWKNLSNSQHKQFDTFLILRDLYKNEAHRIGFESDAPDAGDAQTVASLYQNWLLTIN